MKRLRYAAPALAVFFLALAFQLPASAQFETRSSSPTATTPLSMVVADFNHDGKMDFATGSVTQPEIQVFLGNGDGTFRAPVAYDVGSGTGPLAAADLNGDGNPDLIVINGACPNDVCYDSVAVLLGNGDGTFQVPVNYATPPGPYGLVIGDFNGDGKLDIATIDKADYSSVCACVGVLLGNGDGTFQEPAIETSLGQYPWAVSAGHFTHTGNLDLAVTFSLPSSGEVQILLGNGDGTFLLGANYTVAPEPLSIVSADFRHDGRTDIAVGEFEGMGVAVLLGNGNGTFDQPVVYKAGTPLGVAAADVNGDGKIDLVAVTPTNDYQEDSVADVLLGNGDGTFRNAVPYPAGEFPRAVAIADFNGDHMPDIAVTDQDGNQEIVLLNTGVASFSPTTPLNFKKQKTGTTSSSQTVELTNTGKTALKISSMKASSQFGVTSTCGKSVSAGATCSISVTFSPTSKGTKSGTVTIIDSASSKPMVIELSGTGT
jgi:hypothetical protein